ncbi:toxin-antitoxin system YwqK family antitoxin [Tenacibaculum agarivorans]|uniref:toxin-antitoxin system YwqK family antitoxin n=1 Tax=Tenacibaculum agarivorans TaxID=1908389 RepID=UPI00094BA5F5|nr:hypothetical protein [Tenacibaculum agarivorans]
MKKILLSLLILIISCSKDNVKKEFYPNGSLKLEFTVDDQSSQNGFYREYYENGELKTKTNFLEGIINDTLYSYYKNGNIKEKGILIVNKKNGWWKYYDTKGKLNKKIEHIF